MRQRRRGRKRLRPRPLLVESYFSRDIPNVRGLARRLRTGRDRAQRILARSLTRYAAAHEGEWLALLPSDRSFVVIADAIWHRVRGMKLTVYIMLVRPVGSDTAVVAPPFLEAGHETAEGWRNAFLSLPPRVVRRTCALVCDGHVALVSLGKRHGWHVQRCHFHLLANLQMYAGSRMHPRTIALLAVVRRLITTTDAEVTARSLDILRALRVLTPSRGMRRVLSGLATNYRDFRTYLRLPRLALPATTNAAESYISGIREVLRQCRGFRSVTAMRLWLTGYAIWRRTIRCNGKHQQN